jgi:hypothetical protein
MIDQHHRPECSIEGIRSANTFSALALPSPSDVQQNPRKTINIGDLMRGVKYCTPYIVGVERRAGCGGKRRLGGEDLIGIRRN